MRRAAFWLEFSKLLSRILGLDIPRLSRYHTVLLGLSMTFLVEGVLSKKAPLTEGVCKHFVSLLALFDLRLYIVIIRKDKYNEEGSCQKKFDSIKLIAG